VPRKARAVAHLRRAMLWHPTCILFPHQEISNALILGSSEVGRKRDILSEIIQIGMETAGVITMASTTPTGRGVQEGIGAAADKAQEAVGRGAEALQDAIGRGSERAQDVAGRVADRAHETAGRVGDRMRDVAHTAGQKADDLGQVSVQSYKDFHVVGPKVLTSLELNEDRTRRENNTFLGVPRKRIMPVFTCSVRVQERPIRSHV